MQKVGIGFGEESTLARLCRFFQSRNGIDFSYYKPGTMHRRLERRMQLSTVASVEEYLDHVESDEGEANSLFRDLLVEVTHFFRDPEAFAILRDKLIPQLIEDSEGEEEFRAWVCGCATGEEAYSVAMVIHSCMAQSKHKKRPFKVFATDVHPSSIELAGEGVFSEVALRYLPESFRERYFLECERGFKVKQEIRQRVIFAINDATKDPPFTRLNFISCRNLLIYLLPPIQKRILSIFHFGLREKGILFLGPSETVGDMASEFDEVERHWRMFRKRIGSKLTDTFQLPQQLSSTAGAAWKASTTQTKTLRHFQRQTLASSALETLLNRYLPSSLLVDEYNELVHSIGDARKLLTFPEGKPTNNVLQLLGNELSVPVGTALHRSRKHSDPVVFRGVRLQIPGEDERVCDLKIESLEQRNETLYLISFLDTVESPDVKAETFDLAPLANAGEQIGQLKLELNYTRETLQATAEELESSNEELQATNEELVASNEELQSTNEELQSANEELHTVNQENHQRIDQLNEVTEDLELLLSRNSMGILFLDRNFNIRKFTRSITRYFDLQPNDIGRNIDNFTHRTGVPNLYERLRESMKSGSEFTVEHRTSNNEEVVTEVALKYEGESPTGVMLTIGQKTAQGFGVASKQFYLPAGAGFWQWPDVKNDEMWWSPRCFQLLGLEQDHLPTKFSMWRDFIHPDDAPLLRNAGTEQCIFVQQGYLVVRMKCIDDVYRKFEYRAAFVMDEDDHPKSMMGSFAPFEDRQLEELESRLPPPHFLKQPKNDLVK